MSYKVLVSDKLGEAGIRLFEQDQDIEVDVKTDLSPEALKEIIGQYHGLAVRSATKVTKELLEAAENLQVIGRAGIGVDNIDVDEATRRGIIVMNTPGGNVVTTAEHAIAMMMSLTRNIPQGTSSLKAGRWDKKKLQGREVMKKTLGVIGFGKIGSIVANRARGLKMNVLVYDPVVTPENIKKTKCEPVNLDELYERSDYISVHVPKIKKTLNMINKNAFAKMKDGVMLIHCARGGIVNEEDLYEAIQMGRVGGAALDVFAQEPPPENFKLFELDNVICTPHLGASTLEAQTNVAVDIAHQIIGYLKDDTIKNAVNVPSVSGKVLEELDPFIKMADRMGRMLAQLSEGHIKSVEIDYDGDFGDNDMSPVRTAVICGLLEPLVLDDVNAVNAPYLAKEKGIKILESSSDDAQEFINLITVTVRTEKDANVVSGTLFGKSDPRIIRINDFRLEMRPEGYLALIQNMDIPGEIGSIGTILGEHNVNIGRMTVGQEEPEGERNIVFLRTDTPLTREVLDKLETYPRTRRVIYMEL